MAQGVAITSTVPQGDEFEDPIDEFEDGAGDAEALRLAEIEARATRQGWRPLAQYRGEPGTWVDAEAFIERGRNFLPFVQKKLNDTEALNQNMVREMTAMRDELAEARQVLQEVRQRALNADQAGYQRAKREIEAEKRAAVVEGDTAAYDVASAKLEALEEGWEEREAPPAPAPVSERPQPRAAAPLDPAIEQFLAENPWFQTDPQLNQAMQGYHVALKAERPGLTLAQNFAEAKRRVVAAFPEKFGIEPGNEPEEESVQPPRRPASPTPAGRTRVAEPPRGKQGFDRISDPTERAQAKTAYTRMKRHDPELTVEQYLTLYDDPHADVLEMRQKKAKS